MYISWTSVQSRIITGGGGAYNLNRDRFEKEGALTWSVNYIILKMLAYLPVFKLIVQICICDHNTVTKLIIYN